MLTVFLLMFAIVKSCMNDHFFPSKGSVMWIFCGRANFTYAAFTLCSRRPRQPRFRPPRRAVVKTGFDVMRREGTGYAKVIVVDAVQDLTTLQVNSRFDHGAPWRPETGLP